MGLRVPIWKINFCSRVLFERYNYWVIHVKILLQQKIFFCLERCLDFTQRKAATLVTVEIPQAIDRLEHVYSFDKIVDAVMSLIGTTDVAQGPQGTVLSVVIEEERRILKSLHNIKDLLHLFNPSLTTKVSIKSLLLKTHFEKWEVVPLTYPYSLNSITDSAVWTLKFELKL